MTIHIYMFLSYENFYVMGTPWSHAAQIKEVLLSLKNKLPEGGEPLGADCVSTVVAC